MRFKEYLEEQLPGGETRGTAPFDIKKKRDPAFPLKKSEKELINHVNKIMKRMGLFQKIKSARLTEPNVLVVAVPIKLTFILDDKLATLLGKDPFFKAVVFGKGEAVFTFES